MWVLMVEIGSVKIIPSDKWLEPSLLVECELRTPPNECILEIRGSLLTEDGRIIGNLEEAPDFSQESREIGSLAASDNSEYQRLVSEEKSM